MGVGVVVVVVVVVVNVGVVEMVVVVCGRFEVVVGCGIVMFKIFVFKKVVVFERKK